MQLSPQAVQQWVSGETRPSGRRLRKLADVLKTNIDALLDDVGGSEDGEARRTPTKPITLINKQGIAEPLGDLQANEKGGAYQADRSKFIPIRVGSFRLQAGITGFTVDYVDEDTPPIYFRMDWLSKKNLNPSKLVACTVTGDSMETRLYAGDTVLVNTEDNTPSDGEVFAVNYEGELVIKRLARNSGRWWLSSDNPDKARYPDKLCDGDYCLLIGKVVQRQSTRL